jgi:uncharacterized protein (DUF2252 family)
MCAQLSLAERRSMGTVAAAHVPPQAHRGWEPAAGRRSPVDVLAEQEADRLPDLVPVRHGRMMVSPFTFYRGAAAVMSEDLKGTPVAGLPVQLCGDAHLSNFGVFGSPERRLLFDVNDFDETLPGPFEYDVKRMVASFVIAARDNGFASSEAKAAAREATAAYRTAMASFADLGTMDIWYASLDEDTIKASVHSAAGSIEQAGKAAKSGKKKERAREQEKMAKLAVKRTAEAAEKAHTRDSMQALSKLGELVGGRYQIASQPPVLIPLRELAFEMAPEMTPEQIEESIRDQFRAYRATLQPDRRHLLEQFEIVDAARKVVGVGSVGTRAYIVLLQGRDASDPLFLQIKEATSSVLEAHLPRSRYRQHGQRVVQGQRLMQASSDIYLGWTRGPQGRDFYWRQLRDMKGSVEIEAMTPLGLNGYARACGWTLARAHARSGDPVAMAAYLGDGDEFDRSITDFAIRYADQNERDYQEFVDAIKSGELTAAEGV